MFQKRGHHILLVAGFIGAIGVVGILQATIEIGRSEPPQFLDVFRQAPTPPNLRSFENDLESRSWFAAAARPVMQYCRLVVLGDAGEKALVGRDGWWFYRPDVRYLVEPCGPATRDAVVSAIVSFRDQLATRGIRLLVVPAPVKVSVYPEMLTARAAGTGSVIDTHTRSLIAALATAGVETLDLLATFARSSGDSITGGAEKYYLARDTHWTGGGARLAAAAVARRIRELDWVQPGPVQYDSRPVEVARQGDIPRMLRAPWIESLFAPEWIQCHQVIRQDSGEPYRDDPDARVLVLGDSFLRIYEADEPGSAGFIAHLARELGQPVASIVNDGGGSTLVRQQLASKPSLLVNKTLVVWEFVERDIRFGMEGWQNVSLRQQGTTRSAPSASAQNPPLPGS